jgi:ATP-dependent Lhr-like helicase
LAGDRDVLIGAATASGKTEAAWLPICSTLLFDAEHGQSRIGVQALYVSPLKALINDQYDRLTKLCTDLDLPVYRWHGDVSGSRKSAVMRSPAGILLITPESLEALFVTSGTRVGSIIGALRYIVIDEFHCFIGTERGAQPQSLLHRIDLLTRYREGYSAGRVEVQADYG